MEEILKFIAETSFPVAVAAFLLLRLEKRIEGLTEAIERLRHCQTCMFSPQRERDIKKASTVKEVKGVVV